MIIAVGHRQNTGKDTLCKFISSVIKERSSFIKVEQRSFAYKLKEFTHGMYSYLGVKSPQYYEEHSAEKNKLLPNGKTVRDLWIEIGNKLREVDENIWVNGVIQNYPPDVMLISDMRYPNEAKMVKEASGVLIKVVRPSIPESDDVADTALKDWTDWNEIIVASTLQELYEHAASIVEKYCQQYLRKR